MNLKALAKDTVIYGMSSIVGRFLNYLLVPLYTSMIPQSEYGIVTNLYAYTAFFLAVLTFGMETTLFRFSNKDGENPDRVFSTSLGMVGIVAAVFVGLVVLLINPVSSAMGYSAHPQYIVCMAVIVAMDAVQAIMFSRLRQQGRALKFMSLKLGFIIPNVLLNLAVFLLFPEFYRKFGVGIIFYVNLICTFCVNFGFIREIGGIRHGIDGKLARRMLSYSLPLLVLGLIGILNQVADKMLFPYLMPGERGMHELGVYGACVKIAMLLSLLTQAFRYAYEPIVFNGSRDAKSPETLADGMKYFVIFALLAFLAVMCYLPVVRYFIDSRYWDGLAVVPIVMMAEIFMGVYFNLSFWYKLSDQTWWGGIMSLAGALVMIAVNVFGVPRFSYLACAWGGLFGYGTAMLLSWFIGQKKFPIPYDMGKIALFSIVAMVIYAGVVMTGRLNMPYFATLGINTVLLVPYCALVVREIRRR